MIALFFSHSCHGGMMIPDGSLTHWKKQGILAWACLLSMQEWLASQKTLPGLPGSLVEVKRKRKLF
jgi:hypothetical protein